MASFAQRVVKLTVPSRICDTDGQLVKALRQGSEELKNITDLFIPMMKRFRIFFFWESLRTAIGTSSEYVCVCFELHCPQHLSLTHLNSR